MKRVITTVGTSIFTNYRDKQGNDISVYFDSLKNKSFSDLKDNSNNKREVKLINKVKNWCLGNNEASAEIKSLIKIQEEAKENIEVFLLTTDTILSNSAAKLISEFFKNNDNISIKEIKVVSGLQTTDSKKFENEGVDNLVEEIRTIFEDEIFSLEDGLLSKDKNYKIFFEQISKEFIFNISGGYKGVIPFMSIIAQLYSIDIKYIFEDSNEIITIPQTPLAFDSVRFEKWYWELSENKNKEFILEKEWLQKELQEFKLIYKLGNGKYKITSLAKLLIDYAERYAIVGENVMGYFVEYKIWEWFLNFEKEKYDEIYHSVKKEKSVNFGEEEIDILLEKSSEYIGIEIKPLLWVVNNIEDIKSKVKKRVEKFIEGGLNLTEFRLLVYTSEKDKTITFKKELEVLKQEIGVRVEVYEVYISDSSENSKKRKSAKKKKNPYQVFESVLKEGDIVKIKTNK